MYCQKVVGDANFSIDEWNKQFKLCNELGIPFPKEDNTPCKNQCFECASIVGQQRLKTQQLIEKYKLV